MLFAVPSTHSLRTARPLSPLSLHGHTAGLIRVLGDHSLHRRRPLLRLLLRVLHLLHLLLAARLSRRGAFKISNTQTLLGNSKPSTASSLPGSAAEVLHILQYESNRRLVVTATPTTNLLPPHPPSFLAGRQIKMEDDDEKVSRASPV